MSDPPWEGPQAKSARNGRNWLIAGALLAFVVLVFVVPIVRLGANVAH